MSATTRLPATERRRALLDTALRVFSSGSYRGTTTAEIAREAGVTEPVLYRHFGSKRELYLACIDEAWRRLRSLWEETIAAEPDAREWLPKMAGAYACLRDTKLLVAELWMQAVVEAGDDPQVRKYLKRHMRAVHAYVAGMISRAQEAGAIKPERDPEAEAWIFIAAGLLGTVGRRLGGLLHEEDFARIRAARRSWLLAT
jgi:AcrR family transcriptional regulator